ncbi:protein chain elongation factor EF-Ts [Azospirillaceae bacterium]
MAEITASLVKTLREKTGAGMMDCKKALNETAGDLEAAVDWLRKKGLAAAAKKAGRVAAEGLVAVATRGAVGAVVELNAETDFVARNDKFQAFVAKLAELALSGDGTVESLNQTVIPETGQTVAETLTQLVATIGENMALRRVKRLAVPQGAVVSYMHSALVPNLGKIGVLIGLETSSAHAAVSELGKKLAMHIAAARPDATTIDEVDPSALDRERNILTEQAQGSGKSAEIIAKMVEGRLRKYYEEVVLLEQVFVIDGESRVKKVVEAAAKDAGAPIKVTGFARFQLGEGVEKAQTDFAAEVAAAVGQG